MASVKRMQQPVESHEEFTSLRLSSAKADGEKKDSNLELVFAFSFFTSHLCPLRPAAGSPG